MRDLMGYGMLWVNPLMTINTYIVCLSLIAHMPLPAWILSYLALNCHIHSFRLSSI